jgi:hypothetical protein
VKQKEIIQKMVEENRFKAALLTNSAGLTLVGFPDGPEAEMPAAMIALLQRTFEKVQSHVGLRAMSEMLLCDEVGQKLVCCRFSAGGHDLILAILVPPNRLYQQALEKAIEQIKQIW